MTCGSTRYNILREFPPKLKNDLMSICFIILKSSMDKLDSGIAYVMTKYSEHPKSCGMTPVGHFLFTMRLFALSFVSSVAFLVHAVFPWILTDTGEYLLELLHEHSCPLKSVSNVHSITSSNTPAFW